MNVDARKALAVKKKATVAPNHHYTKCSAGLRWLRLIDAECLENISYTKINELSKFSRSREKKF